MADLASIIPVNIAQKSFKMPRRCVMIKCGNEPNKEEYLSVHKCPADSDKRKRWTKVVQIARTDFSEPSPGNKNVVICSEHFRDDDYEQPRNLRIEFQQKGG